MQGGATRRGGRWPFRAALSCAVTAVAVALCAGPATAAPDVVLDFSQAVPDTILDAAGQGTGFTRVIGGGGLEPEALALNPAAGRLSVTSVTGGTAAGSSAGADQDNALSVEVDPSDGPYAIEATLAGPLALAAPGHSAGIYVGTSQDAYVRAAVVYHQAPEVEAGPRLLVSFEGAESGRRWRQGLAELAKATAVELRLEVDPASGSVLARYRLDGGEALPIDPAGQPVALAELADRASTRVTAGIAAGHFVSGGPFTVAYDRFAVDAPPDVRLFTSPSSRDGVPRTRVTALFSQPMDPASVSEALLVLDAEGRPVPGAVSVSPDGTVAAFVPAEGLVYEAAYTAVVAATAADVTGNRLPEAATLSFRVEAPAADRTPRAAGAGAGPAESPRCAAVPPPPARRARGEIRLDARQLRITRRIAQAALRRAAAVEAWLDAGLVAGDLCGGGLSAEAFGPGVALGQPTGAVSAAAVAAPRPIVVRPPRAGRAAVVAVSARQLAIDQRIARAAVRRADALLARLDGGLTGGDVRDGAVTADRLAPELAVVSASQEVDPPAASRTRVRPPRGHAGRVRLSAAQLRINQRIAQAAVRRTNEVIRRLSRGLTSADFRPGSITAVDLDPGLRG